MSGRSRALPSPPEGHAIGRIGIRVRVSAPGQPHRQTIHRVGRDPQAELWLGAHPSAPSQIDGGTDLLAWERAHDLRLPYLLKVLSAASPLSLQAHPTPAQAAEGFARENALGIDIAAAHRNYRDGDAKPELIVAVDDGFQALCGLRPVAQAVAELRALAEKATDPAPILAWADVVAAENGLHNAVLQVLRAEPGTAELVAALTQAGADHPLISRLASFYPGDPGIAVALLLNHVTLQAGESLWLPAGNIHAYLVGTGVELMGPSDNVLRGGLTPKHVDVEELAVVLDFTGGEPSYLPAVQLSEGAVSYRPASVDTGAGVPFELVAITADARVRTPGAAVGVALDGAFSLSVGAEVATFERGATFLVAEAADLSVTGAGRLFLATAPTTGSTPHATTF